MDSDNQNTGSILDRVLSQKQTEEIEHFNPVEVVSNILKILSTREEDVLRRRYGINGKEAETLEQIGEIYKVTRERIRQVETEAINKIKKSNQTGGQIHHLSDAIIGIINNHGGIMKEENFMREILDLQDDRQTTRAATLFIIRFLFSDKLKPLSVEGDFHMAWQLKTAPTHLVADTIQQAEEILSSGNKPLKLNELLEKIRQSKYGEEHKFQLTDEAISSYIEISTKLAKNPYGEYGLAEWGTIVPKRMNDKIYLVLKKAGKPLHFNEITKLINETKFDHRTAYSPTVHNELILNDQYVLVGRGIYALKEWGYKPGVVADILIDILKKSNKPMKKEELADEVLKQRLVKKNTIYLVLTNRKKFNKRPSGEYTLV